MTRSEVNEYVLALEKMNPTEDPAYSSLLNGVWEVVGEFVGFWEVLGVVKVWNCQQKTAIL